MMTRSEMKTRNERLIAQLKESNIIIDNHDHSEKQLLAVAEFYDPNKGIAGIFPDCKYQSLNAIVGGGDGKLHLSTASIGPVLIGDNYDNINDGVIFTSGQVLAIHFMNGSVIYPKLYKKEDKEVLDRV